MNFYPIYKNKKLLPWIKWWILKGNKVMPKHLSEWINSAEAITITGVYKGSPLLNLNLNGNTSQTGTPTPEAPVPVQVVKEINYININDESYKVDLGGKNLLNIKDNLRDTDSNGITTTYNSNNSITISGEATSNYAYLTNGISCTLPIGTYTISIDKKLPHRIYINCRYTDNTTGNQIIESNTMSKTFTTEKVIQTITLIISDIVSGTTYNETIYFQLEKGNQPTTFSPYVANPIELCKIGDYQDVIYKQNNKWYVAKYIGKVNLSDFTWSTYGTSISGITRYTTTQIPNVKYVSKNTELGNALAEKYQNHTGSGLSAVAYNFAIDVSMVQATDDTSSGKPSGLFYYALAEKTTTEITDETLLSQLEAIYNAKLKSGTNTITQTPSDLPFYLNFRYYEKG